MKTNLFKTVIAILFLSSIFSCSPEDGKNGEQGPAGTANVMYSDWLDQSWNSIDNNTLKQMQIVENRLNPDFVNNGGIVLGFFKFQDNVPFNLPHQDITNKNIRDFYPVFFSSDSQIRFLIQSTDGTDLTAAEINGSGPSILARYRYVLIPGGVNISGRSSNDFKKMSYQEICNYFNIPE